MREIPLANGRGVAIVDDEDYEVVARYSWRLDMPGGQEANRRYARARHGKTTVLMHRLILDAQPSEMVDHVDGDGLNNRRSNLRLCTRAENNRNRRRHANAKADFKGVHWSEARQRWIAQIRHAGRHMHLGTFRDPILAAQAYDAAARQHFGEFARLNFPRDGEQAA